MEHGHDILASVCSGWNIYPLVSLFTQAHTITFINTVEKIWLLNQELILNLQSPFACCFLNSVLAYEYGDLLPPANEARNNALWIWTKTIHKQIALGFNPYKYDNSRVQTIINGAHNRRRRPLCDWFRVIVSLSRMIIDMVPCGRQEYWECAA